MNAIIEQSVAVKVETAYLPEQSDPEAQRFVFSYHITITNQGTQTVQLLSRRWLVTDGDEQTQVVEGEGVVGEQPTIEPGNSYSYTSGTILPTHVGSMRGHYRMRQQDGEEFFAPIEPFTLAQPNALH